MVWIKTRDKFDVDKKKWSDTAIECLLRFICQNFNPSRDSVVIHRKERGYYFKNESRQNKLIVDSRAWLSRSVDKLLVPWDGGRG